VQVSLPWLSPHCVGPCFRCPLSRTGTPLLHPRYRASLLIWMPPTSGSLPSSSLFRLVRGFAFKAGLSGSPWLPRCLPVKLDAALDPGADPCTHPIAQRSVACRLLNTVGLSRCGTFRGSTPSRSAHADTIAPRLLSRLRIRCTVTSAPARLNSRPVVSGYLGRLCTCKTTRPCQAAT
jgi:hypothetical protein